MKNLFLLFSLLYSTSLLTQTLTGKVDYQELGVSFTIPEGWMGQESANAVIMGSNTVAGLLLIAPNEAVNIQQLKQEAAVGIVDQGVQLQLVGDITTVSDRQIEATYEGSFQSEAARCFGIGKIDGQGNGVTILAITSSAAFGDSQIQAARQLARSVKFFKPVQSAASKSWQGNLAGRRLAYLSSSGGSDYGGGYSGTSTTTNIDLCSTGRFFYYSNSHSSFSNAGGSGGYANGRENNTGNWKIASYPAGPTLVLTFDSGEVSEYAITENEKGHLLLNGYRYFRTTIENCN